MDRTADMRALINRAFFHQGFADQSAEISSDTQRPAAIRDDADSSLVQQLSEEFARTALPEAVRQLLAQRPEFREALTDEYLSYLAL